jgi:hypothetical protein
LESFCGRRKDALPTALRLVSSSQDRFQGWHRQETRLIALTCTFALLKRCSCEDLLVNMQNCRKRNQHVLPKLYLKGFVIETDKPFIWVYKRGEPYNPGNGKITNNPYKRSINNAGVERDFFADPQRDGSTDYDTYENILEKLEKPANPIFQKLCARQAISGDEKSFFSEYIIMMYRRVKSGRYKVRQLLPKTMETAEPLHDFFQRNNLPDTPHLRQKYKDTVERLGKWNNYHISLHNRLAADSQNSFLIPVLREMTWTFYIAEEPHSFLTGDNPVFIPEQFGLGSNVSELSFPISSNVALIASWNKMLKEGFQAAHPEIIKEVNRRTVHQASENVYFCDNQKWVVTALENSSYEYHPIYTVKPMRRVAEIATDSTGAKSLKFNL